MNRRLWPVALVLLAGCNGDEVGDTCKRLLALARTSTDTLIALSAKPSGSYMACGYDWKPALVVEDTTEGRR